jgi:protein-S-isoprenylcysteine O-methyltransferase Ste14
VAQYLPIWLPERGRASVAYAGTPRSLLSATAQTLRLPPIGGLIYGLACAGVTTVFWPSFGVLLSNAPRSTAPWLERSADVGLGVALGQALLAAGLTIDVLIAKSDEERDLNGTYGSVYRTWRAAR